MSSSDSAGDEGVSEVGLLSNDQGLIHVRARCFIFAMLFAVIGMYIESAKKMRRKSVEVGRSSGRKKARIAKPEAPSTSPGLGQLWVNPE